MPDLIYVNESGNRKTERMPTLYRHMLTKRLMISLHEHTHQQKDMRSHIHSHGNKHAHLNRSVCEGPCVSRKSKGMFQVSMF